MALKINLRANERIVINGALLTALKPTALLITNRVSMLLERQIMRPEYAVTPARRIYFSIQCAYMADADERPRFLESVESFISDFEQATTVSQVRDLLAAMRQMVASANFYEALKLSRDLMAYEEAVLTLPTAQPNPDGTPAPESERADG